LVKLEEQNGDYKDALKYLKLLFDLQEDIQNDKKYKVGKELEIKYETAKKDLEIVTLQVEKEREKQNKTLILGIGLLIIILLVIFLLYNRIQRLKKEKEASALSIRMKEKELEFQSAMAQSELNTMQSYLKGLEAERERLAKELHDNIANELLSIDFQLKSIKQVPEETSVQIENLHTEIRNISHELIPPLFKYASLPEIISDYVSKANKNNIDIDLQIEEDLDHIPEKQALEIYRIIQEATSNIVKHAEATAAKISLWRSGSFLKLSIEDNGKGFDINRKQTGIGLQIIKDRVTGLNGVFQIYSLPDSGCKIDISIPIFQLNDDK
jgi:signal transduction histidine kinase